VCNARNIKAREAQRASSELHTLLYLRDRRLEEIAYVTQAAYLCPLTEPFYIVSDLICIPSHL
ncbi:MAG: hypothetical protein SGPRY_008013, partial [Prymnesium sp.]